MYFLLFQAVDPEENCTDFTGHPRGVGRLEMAASNDLEVFWKVNTQANSH